MTPKHAEEAERLELLDMALSDAGSHFERIGLLSGFAAAVLEAAAAGLESAAQNDPGLDIGFSLGRSAAVKWLRSRAQQVRNG